MARFILEFGESAPAYENDELSIGLGYSSSAAAIVATIWMEQIIRLFPWVKDNIRVKTSLQSGECVCEVIGFCDETNVDMIRNLFHIENNLPFDFDEIAEKALAERLKKRNPEAMGWDMV